MKSVFWVLVIVAAISAVVFFQIDDWKRDFSVNVATTSENGPLRPLLLPLTVEQSVEVLKQAVASRSHWQWIDQQTHPDTTVVKLVRTTRLFRFKDDIEVHVKPVNEALASASDTDVAAGSRLHVSSRSRVGKGDLGQNPRNIKELFQAIETITSTSKTP